MRRSLRSICQDKNERGLNSFKVTDSSLVSFENSPPHGLLYESLTHSGSHSIYADHIMKCHSSTPSGSDADHIITADVSMCRSCQKSRDRRTWVTWRGKDDKRWGRKKGDRRRDRETPETRVNDQCAERKKSLARRQLPVPQNGARDFNNNQWLGSLRARRLIYLHRPITPRVNYLYIHCFTGKKGIRSFQLYIGLNLFSRLWLPDVRLHASDGDRQTQPMAFILPAVPSLEDLLHASASTMAEPRNTMSLAKITQKHKD